MMGHAMRMRYMSELTIPFIDKKKKKNEIESRVFFKAGVKNNFLFWYMR